MVIAIIVFVVVISITWRIGYVVVRTQPRRTVLDIVIALEIYKSSPLVKVSKIADVRVITRCLQRRVIQMWCGVYQVFCHVSWPVLLSREEMNERRVVQNILRYLELSSGCGP